MVKPKLAILTDAIRYDNQAALKFFQKIKPVHFYHLAPYGDLSRQNLKTAIKYRDFKDLEEKLLKLKPDIIQGAEPYGSRRQLKLCLIAYRVSKKLNIPLVFPMLENRPAEIRFGPFLAPILKKILASYAKQASLIFYLNNGAKRNLLAAGADPKKLKKLLYGIWGVDCGLFKPVDRSPLTVHRKTRFTVNGELLTNYILFVGRLDEAKGIKYILAAWEKIKDEFPELELVFIGDGELKNEIREERIKKLGIIKTTDLPSYFAKALFTLYPSVTLKRWEEQIGMVNLQSLACGTPVVTTRSGAIPEYISDKVGILVSERDSSALVKAMRKLLKNPKLRQKLGQNGRKYILENFDAQKTVEKVEEILLELVKKV